MELILDLIFFFKIGIMQHLSNIVTTLLDMVSLWKLKEKHNETKSHDWKKN